MKLVKRGEGVPYNAPKHFGYWSIEKVTPGLTSKVLQMGISHFLPSGGAEMSCSSFERVYYCLDGQLTIKGKNEEHNMEQGDMIYIAAGEERSFKVSNTSPATILVVIAKVT